MGMFDTLFDAHGNDWQTKAFDCLLSTFKIGDEVRCEDFPASYPSTYQVEILGGPSESPYTDSFATVRDHTLVSVNDPRDLSLPLLNYSGHLSEEGA